MNPQNQAFIALMKSPLKFRLFLFSKLPSAYFSGVRIKEVDEERAVVTVPYKWFSKNPFHSTYFACLAMAAEMSTGVLAMMHVYKREPAVSMLVVKMEAAYFKKAVGSTSFICEDGKAIRETIEKSINTKEGQTITAVSTGINKDGEKLAEFRITWSFKAKNR